MELELYLTGSRSKWPTYEKFAEGMRIRFNVLIPKLDKTRPTNFLVVSNPIWYRESDEETPFGSNTIQIATDIIKWKDQIDFLKGLGWPIKYDKKRKDWYVGCLELNEENYDKTVEICKNIMRKKFNGSTDK